MRLKKPKYVRDTKHKGVWLHPSQHTNYGSIVQNLVNSLNDLTPYSGAINAAAAVAGQLWEPPYYKDMCKVAKAGGLHTHEVVLANHAYELSRFGCTTRIDEQDGRLRMLRTLDWPLPGIGKHTVVVRHVKENCTSVTFPGLVGSLTGMRHGEYAVAINAAPASGFATGWQPLLLLRWVLENCDSYTSAKKVLCKTDLVAGVFFTLVGVDDACIIERTARDYAVRGYDGDPIVIANHYVHKDFVKINPKKKDSRDRYAAFIADPEAWHEPPVLHSETVQLVELVPESGHCDAWGVVKK